MTSNESQKHGFIQEKDILKNVYGATDEKLSKKGYTDKFDLDADDNKLDPVNLSIKTTVKDNNVCMGDCLRFFDSVSNTDKPIHLTVIFNQQIDNKKKVKKIVEVNLTNAVKELFGSLTREQIKELDTLVKSIPQKREPTKEEHKKMFDLQKKLKLLSKAINLNIKCDSSQSRLQCSFNKFQQFLKENPSLIIEESLNETPNKFRGGQISEEILSEKRKRKKKVNLENLIEKLTIE
jgi:hypothetical protein